MKKALFKDTFIEIKKSASRFISILAIVMIGVAFFVGVSSSSAIMEHSADVYFDKYNLSDIRLVSTFGFTDEDVDEISKIEGVNGVYPAYTKDVYAKINNTQQVYRMHSISSPKEEDDFINQFTLVEGRLPNSVNECVVEGSLLLSGGLKIGDEIEVYLLDEDLEESLNTTVFEIVGKVETVEYVSYDKGPSLIGSGVVDSFMYVNEDAFSFEYYTDVFLTVEGVKQYNSYKEAYFDALIPVKNELNKIAAQQIDIRYEDVLNEANEKLAQAQQEYDEGVLEFEKEIKDAQKKIDEGEYEVIEGDILLKVNQDLAEKEFAQAQETIVSAQSLIDEGNVQHQQAEQEFKEANKLIFDQIEINERKLEAFDALHPTLQEDHDKLLQQKSDLDAKLNDKEAAIETTQKELDDLREDESSTEEQIKAKELELETLNQEKEAIIQEQEKIEAEITVSQTLVDERQEITTQIALLETSISAGQATLDQTKMQLEDSQVELNKQKNMLEQAKIDTNIEFEKAENDLKKAKTELEDAKETLAIEQKNGEEKLADAQEELIIAQKDIELILEPEWYVLDRESHFGYRDYGSSASSMEAIATIFPIFFFLVAALVCLTTMTRMVDEQRQIIGTFKALGYKKTEIMMKYLLYAGLSSFIGSLLGLVLGMAVFPYVIFTAWNIKFTIPELILTPQYDLMITAVIVAVSITMISAFAACYASLNETSASLMRPKAPKIGKRIFLERLPGIWQRLTFSEKVTARNLFRYKKRFFMTIIGISGCTALLLSGFGIKDSVSTIVDSQFSELFKYEVLAQIKPEVEDETAFLMDVEKQDNVKQALYVSLETMTLQEDENTSVSVVVPSDLNQFEDYVTLQNRTSKNQLTLSDKGIIISEKLAKQFDLTIGDSITLKNKDQFVATFEISGITENYIGHYVYMTPALYKQMFELSAKQNTLLIQLNVHSYDSIKQFASDLAQNEFVQSTTTYVDLANSFDDMITSLNLIVIVLIISSGLLACVVLYNLSNVNISERNREIATIKVLGFTDKEVNSYVNKESVLLSLIGAILGLGLGKILHEYIMQVAEMETIMFGRVILPISYVYAIVITIIFTLFVNKMMNKKLRNIKMVESLKSVE